MDGTTFLKDTTVGFGLVDADRPVSENEDKSELESARDSQRMLVISFGAAVLFYLCLIVLMLELG